MVCVLVHTGARSNIMLHIATGYPIVIYMLISDTNKNGNNKTTITNGLFDYSTTLKSSVADR